MVNKVPELENYVGNGYNSKDGRFLGKRIFKISYGNENKIDWNGDKRQVPDQVSYSSRKAESHNESTELMRSKSDYDRLYSLAVDAEFSGVTFTGSADSQLMYRGSLFKDKNSSYALSMYQSRIFEFERIGEELTDGFIDDVLELPSQILGKGDADQIVKNVEKYFGFFDVYGTHYLSKGQMGGNIVMSTSVKNSLIKKTSETDVNVSITAGYDKVIASGKMKVDAAYKGNNFTEEHRDSFKFDLDVMGGSFTPSDSGEAVKDWKVSIYDTPRLMLNLPGKPEDKFTELRAISELVEVAGANKAIVENINMLIPLYVSQDQDEDGLLTRAQTVEFNKAESDTRVGFLIGRLKKDGGGTAVILGYDDEEENPTELRAGASIQYGPSQGRIISRDKYLSRACFTMPTVENTHYKTKKSDVAGSVESDLQFIGFSGIGEAPLGEWTTIPFKTAGNSRSTGNVIAKSDGFLLGLIECADAIAKGNIRCLRRVDNDWKEFCGASIHNNVLLGNSVSANSFCVPISKGMEYEVKADMEHGNANTVVSFVPLNPVLKLSETPVVRNHDIEFSAKTDGFLITTLTSDTSGTNTGYANLFAYGKDEDLTAEDLMTSTSVAQQESVFSVPMNTAMTPILKDQDYMVKFKQTRGSVSTKSYWVSLTVLSEEPG